jgi:hypothetical protein
MAFDVGQVQEKVLACIADVMSVQVALSTPLRTTHTVTEFHLASLAMFLEETFEVEANDLEFAPPGVEVTPEAIAGFIWAKVDSKQQAEAKKKAEAEAKKAKKG